MTADEFARLTPGSSRWAWWSWGPPPEGVERLPLDALYRAMLDASRELDADDPMAVFRAASHLKGVGGAAADALFEGVIRAGRMAAIHAIWEEINDIYQDFRLLVRPEDVVVNAPERLHHFEGVEFAKVMTARAFSENIVQASKIVARGASDGQGRPNRMVVDTGVLTTDPSHGPTVRLVSDIWSTSGASGVTDGFGGGCDVVELTWSQWPMSPGRPPSTIAVASRHPINLRGSRVSRLPLYLGMQPWRRP